MLQIISLCIALLLIRFRIFRPPRQGLLYCGLAGFSGHRAVDETKLRFLLAENQSRGGDSTGVYGNTLYKDNITAKQFIQTPGFRAAIRGAKTVGGHTRAATFGAKTQMNAHPFQYGMDTEWYVVGAHNGFITPGMLEYHTKEFGFDKAFDVDSMLIFASIAKFQDFKIISKIEGAMALWFTLPNKDKDTIYLYQRNHTRSLHFGQAKEGIYFSSEAEPLWYIGCTQVYATAADALYTIRKGEVVDRYKMPLPILKSMARHVTRAGWRAGIPAAEINALPITVITQANTSVSTTDKNQNKLPFTPDTPVMSLMEGGRWRAFETQANKDKTTEVAKYGKDAWNDELHADYFMFIKSIEAELKDLHATPINVEHNPAYHSKDFVGCILHIRVKTSEGGEALLGWSLISTVEFSGITDFMGMSIIKVPFMDCGKEMKFLAYDPVEAFGPFEFTVKPERGKVMEVTLRIPFRAPERKEGEEGSELIIGDDEAKRKANDADRCRINLASLKRDNNDPVCSTSRGDDGAGETADLRLLSGEESRVHRPRSQGSLTGETDEAESAALSLSPQLESPSVKLKLNALLPNQANGLSKRITISKIIDRDGLGYYQQDKEWPKYIVEFITKHGITQEYIFAYASHPLHAKVQYVKLVNDAARCMAYDRYLWKQWYHIQFYIHMLLVELPWLYLSNDLFKTTKAMNDYGVVKTEVDSKILPYNVKKTSDAEEVNKKDNDKYRDQIKFLHVMSYLFYNFKKETLDNMSMTKEEMKHFSDGLMDIEVLLDGLVKSANDVLISSEGKITMDMIALREQIVKSRNFMKNLSDDVADCRNQVDQKLYLASLEIEV